MLFSHKFLGDEDVAGHGTHFGSCCVTSHNLVTTLFHRLGVVPVALWMRIVAFEG